MATPLSAALARTDYVLSKLQQSRMLHAMQEVAANPPRTGAGFLARDILKQPGSLAKADQFIGDHSMRLGKYLGSGAESLVWEVVPRTGPDRHVLKLRPGQVEDFDFPEDVPGIAPYWAKTQLGPEVAVALQPRADVLWKPGVHPSSVFDAGGERVRRSLAARGWDWGDNHAFNFGVMPGGEWGAFDGFVDAIPPDQRLGHYNDILRRAGLPGPVDALPTPDEAIRMLRLTPEEQAAIYGAQ